MTVFAVLCLVVVRCGWGRGSEATEGVAWRQVHRIGEVTEVMWCDEMNHKVVWQCGESWCGVEACGQS